MGGFTKLQEWILFAVVFGVIYLALSCECTNLKLSPETLEVVRLSPIYLLIAFGSYSLFVVGYRVATFNDCEEAAKELTKQIQDAKEDLKNKGYEF